ncbi:hypothetical protein CDL15_Pgr025572 [Punica granatum]|uniref:Uncharacterized protein n=1 Tax=Punica granatum TaxID=22663 RepID=A0A218WB13_PUNGR|nr:hypothetical protein CDL15_Pgr025572 [Punica granatum]
MRRSSRFTFTQNRPIPQPPKKQRRSRFDAQQSYFTIHGNNHCTVRRVIDLKIQTGMRRNTSTKLRPVRFEDSDKDGGDNDCVLREEDDRRRHHPTDDVASGV